MKKFAAIVAILLLGASAMKAQDPVAPDSIAMAEEEVVVNDTVVSAATTVMFDNYTLTAPANLVADTDAKSGAAIYRTPDGSIGISVQTEADPKVGEKGAYKLCQSMAKGFHLADAKVTKANIHGLRGATVSGMLEGRAITIAVLADGKKYIKVVVMSIPSLAAEARETVYSIARLK